MPRLPLVSTHMGLDHFVYRDIEQYVVTHQLEHMFEFVIQEMAYHRPEKWQPFLVTTLERYIQFRQQKRLLPKPLHLRHKEDLDFFCGRRSLRKMCRSIMYLLMSERPDDPIQTTLECFTMPDDLYILEQSGLLAARHKRFIRNSPAYIRAFKKGLVLEESQYKPMHRAVAWLWKRWNASGSGKMDSEEFAKMIEHIGGEHANLSIADLDMNDDLTVDFEEFMLFMEGAVLPADPVEQEEYMFKLKQRMVNWDSIVNKLHEDGRLKTHDDPLAEELYRIFVNWDSKDDLELDMDELQDGCADIGVEFGPLVAKYNLEENSKLDHFTFCGMFMDLWEEKEARAQVSRTVSLITDRALYGMSGQLKDILLPDDATRLLLELFDLWDTNKNGVIDGEEHDEFMKDIGGGERERALLAKHAVRPDQFLNCPSFVTFIRELWAGGLERIAHLALYALRKKVSGNALTQFVVQNVVKPDELNTMLGQLFDMWDEDHNGTIKGEELAVVLRDIGIDADVILKISDKQAMDREEFCEFLKIEWQGKELQTTRTAIQALEARRASGGVRAQLEMAGAIESSLAAKIAPKLVNEKLKELFIEWDVDGTGFVELDELERMMNQPGEDFKSLIVNGFPSWLMETIDLDHSGKLDVDEFVSFLKGLWEDKALELAEKMIRKLRYDSGMISKRIERIKHAWELLGHPLEREWLQGLLDCCPSGCWDGLNIPPIPREGREQLTLTPDEVISAIKEHIQMKTNSEAFEMIDHLEFKVIFGESLLNVEPSIRSIYKVFDLLDTDLSGRIEMAELQQMLDVCCGGGYAEGVMTLNDEDNSNDLDKLEFTKFLTGFLSKDESELSKILEQMTEFAARKSHLAGTNLK